MFELPQILPKVFPLKGTQKKSKEIIMYFPLSVCKLCLQKLVLKKNMLFFYYVTLNERMTPLTKVLAAV